MAVRVRNLSRERNEQAKYLAGVESSNNAYRARQNTLANATMLKAEVAMKDVAQQKKLQQMQNQGKLNEQGLRNTGAMDTTRLTTDTQKGMQQARFTQADKTAATTRKDTVDDRELEYGRGLAATIAGLMGKTGAEEFIPEDVQGKEAMIPGLAASIGQRNIQANQAEKDLAASKQSYDQGQDKNKLLVDILKTMNKSGEGALQGVASMPTGPGAGGNPLQQEVLAQLFPSMAANSMSDLLGGKEQPAAAVSDISMTEALKIAQEARSSLAGNVKSMVPGIAAPKTERPKVKKISTKKYDINYPDESNMTINPMVKKIVGDAATGVKKGAGAASDLHSRLNRFMSTER